MSETPTGPTRLGWVDYFKLLFKGRAALTEVMSQGKIVVDSAHKAGVKTLGFWVTLISAVGAVGAQVGGMVPPPYGVIVMASSGLLYAISRGMVKNADPMGGVKPALTSSEAWINIVGALGQVALSAAGAVDPQTATVLAAIHAGSITVSQALAAGGAQPPTVGEGKDPEGV